MVKQVRIAQRRVGKRIRELRRQRGWSQEFLAAEAGLNSNYLGGIERGERNPSLKNLAKIADALSVTIPDLVELLRDTDASGEAAAYRKKIEYMGEVQVAEAEKINKTSG